MEIFIFWFIFAIIVGVWAGNWGRSGFGYFMLSIILSPILSAFILLISCKLDGGTGKKKCPDCAEHIQREAIVCRYCGCEFEEEKKISTTNKPQEANWKAGVIIIAIALLLVVFFVFINSIKI